MNINAENMDYKELNCLLRQTGESVMIENCLGQRYIAGGQSNVDITIEGTAGNALGAYLNGGTIRVCGNVQDAAGDTMDGGRIIINGSAGDALGYAMRGGSIYVKGNSGYRTGIHMKQYNEKKPVIVIGGGTGSFLGEYLAGGLIIILRLNGEKIGNFTGTGMHGGKIYIRGEDIPKSLPENVSVSIADKSEMNDISEIVKDFSDEFSFSYSEIMSESFYILKNNAENLYKLHYTLN